MTLSRLLTAAALAATLTACHSKETRQKIEAMENGHAVNLAAPATPDAAAPPKAFARHDTDALLDFSYSWPVEAAAIPALAARFTRDMELAHKDAVDTANEDQKAHASMGGEFHGHQFQRSWSTAGQTPALLSLVATTSAFTGGAHPNHGSSALLWDRAAGREIKLAALYPRESTFAGLVTDDWCKAIDKARLDRRGGVAMGGEFDQCPPLTDLAIVPADSDGDGKFDRLRFLADPYVAGPYSEGDYEIAFALEPAWIAAMKPEWRSSFEPRQPQ